MLEKKSKATLVKSVGVLASGTAIAQLFIILSSPVLTRLYTPEAFGMLAAFSAVWAIVGTISKLKYDVAIPLAEDDAGAVNIFAICVLLLCGFTFIIIVFLYFYGEGLLGLLEIGTAANYLWLLPAGLLISEAVTLFTMWGIRKKEFVRVSWAEGSKGAAGVIAQIIMGVSNLGPLGLVLGRLFGQLVAYATLHRSTIREIRSLGLHISPRKIGESARQYYQFPVYRMPAMFVNMLGRQLPFLAIPVLFGLGPSGMFALMHRVLQTPMVFLAHNIVRVFLSKATEAKNAGTLPETMEFYCRILIIVSLPTFALFGLVAPEVFSLVFGEPWRQAGVYAQWFLPQMFLRLVCSPLVTLPMALNKQRAEAVFQVIMLCGKGIAILVGGMLQSVDLTIGLLALSGALSWAWYLFWGMSLVGHSFKIFLPTLFLELLFAIPFCIPVFIARISSIEMVAGDRVVIVAIMTLLLLSAILGVRLKRAFSQ